MPKDRREQKVLDLTSFESWSDEHLSKVSKIAKELVAEHQLTLLDSLKIAVEIHRNIILQQALHAGSTKTPNPLEMIAIQMGASRHQF